MTFAYKSFKYYAKLIDRFYNFYEYVSYIKNNDYIKVKWHLYKNDIVIIQEKNYNISYIIIKAIFKHKGNDSHYYSFIYIVWFENIY